MTSRLVINGRVVAGSRDWQRPSDVARHFDKQLHRAARELMVPGEDGRTIDQPDAFGPNPNAVVRKVGAMIVPLSLPPRAGEPIQDEDGVFFRVCQHLDPAEGWCLADQLTELYQVPYEVLRDWSLKGIVDTAVEKGSQIKRFRVRDPRRCNALAREYRRKTGERKPKLRKEMRERYGALIKR